MEAFLISTVSVALAEIGDKTQLLALVLAARFRRPGAIVAAILVATLANHAAAGVAGAWIAALVPPAVQQWLVAVSFVAMGLWLLVPDDDDDAAARYPYGAFLTTLIAFFLVEIGDKTQIATVVLAARYDPLWAVVAGTTVGMLAANVPVVFMGGAAANRLPMRLVHGVAAGLFVVLGALAVPGVLPGVDLL
ncbi:putative manganese exporter [wastewater metagenome]|uniref:Putative manganese exporter n=2 Tax=unclassified sequences TaxID=12908 RepID=A0A5B8RC40_9ZZZZ|nr:TMEM165/GDT1 family protein [Arhodomonas sp. KWT]QEA06221.1 putative manganese exporter [uncultured organism]